MKSRPIPPWKPRSELFSDHWERDASYTTWRPNGSGDCLLIYTHGGSGSFVGPAGTCVTRIGDAVLYAPTDMQDYATTQSSGRWNLLWCHFTPKPHWQIWLNWPTNAQDLKFIHFEEPFRTRFRSALKETMHFCRQRIPEASDLADNALERALLWAHASVSDKKWLAIDARVRKAIDYLVLHFTEPFRMDVLAAHCRVSTSRLAHLFKDATQTSPQQFLEKHRIQRACNLLRVTRQTVAEIASQVGYHDPFYFTNRFRRHTGKSPSQFRKGVDLKR
jgi:AraC family transcriptional regulator of arabinose operon